MSTPPMIGSAEAAQILGISRNTLIQRIGRGAITPAQSMPGRTGVHLFERAVIEALPTGLAPRGPKGSE